MRAGSARGERRNRVHYIHKKATHEFIKFILGRVLSFMSLVPSTTTLLYQVWTSLAPPVEASRTRESTADGLWPQPGVGMDLSYHSNGGEDYQVLG